MTVGKNTVRYAQVGIGHRSLMFADAMGGPHRGSAELVAMGDANRGRLELRNKYMKEKYGYPDIAPYGAADFETMLRNHTPDIVLVTAGPDAVHDDLIVRAMEAGCDVVTEKPMTIDAARCQRIVDASARTGKSVRVTFNYRYSPPRSQLKELLDSGLIGDVVSVDFEWALDTSHGADYFRRWHRKKANSGGLMVHKSTHHFDLMNWWLSKKPVAVDIEPRTGTGGHGGGDTVMLADIFDPDAAQDPLKRAAGIGDGSYSILVGIAANESMKTGRSIAIPGMVHNIPTSSWER